MYFSLVPDPGYNLSFLETGGIYGEFHLFHGDFLQAEDNRTGNLTWGGDFYIEGKTLKQPDFPVKEILIFVSRCVD